MPYTKKNTSKKLTLRDVISNEEQQGKKPQSQKRGLFLPLPRLFLNKLVKFMNLSREKNIFHYRRKPHWLGKKKETTKQKTELWDIHLLHSHARQICLQTVLAQSELLNKDKMAWKLLLQASQPKFTFTLMTLFVFFLQNHIKITSSLLILPIQNRTCWRIAE